MDSKFIYLIIFTLYCFTNSLSTIATTTTTGKTIRSDSVEAIAEFKGFYKSGNFYFGGQPTLEAINWLKSEGVELFINLRAEKEIEKFSNTAFNEECLLDDYDISYISIPVRYPDSYTPETLEIFAEALSNFKGKVFIHCAGGSRVKLLYMAYLIQFKNYSLNESINIGKQMKYNFMLENLLNRKIQWQFE